MINKLNEDVAKKEVWMVVGTSFAAIGRRGEETSQREAGLTRDGKRLDCDLLEFSDSCKKLRYIIDQIISSETL